MTHLSMFISKQRRKDSVKLTSDTIEERDDPVRCRHRKLLPVRAIRERRHAKYALDRSETGLIKPEIHGGRQARYRVPGRGRESSSNREDPEG